MTIDLGELEEMIFTEQLLADLKFKKRDLPGDLICLSTGNCVTYELGNQVYVFGKSDFGYRLILALNKEDKK